VVRGNDRQQGGPPTFSAPASPAPKRSFERPAQATPYRLYEAPPARTQGPEVGRQPYRPSPAANPKVDSERKAVPYRAPVATNDRERKAVPYRTPVSTDDGKQPPRVTAPGRAAPVGSREEKPDATRERPAPAPDMRQRGPAPDRAQAPKTPSPGKREGDRALKVPEAQFRGPDASPRIIRGQDQPQVQERLRSRLQEQNRQRNQERVRPTFDTVGNVVPGDAKIIYRDGVSRLSVGFGKIRRDFGAPKHTFLVAPRSRLDYWDGYWDGYTDGYWAGKHHRHGSHVVLSFYYGFYFSDPYWFAFYYPGYYPAVYHYWGWCPGWVYPNRAYYAPTEYVYMPATPYRYYYSGYSIDDAGAYRAMEDVRQAWFESEISKLAYHLTDQEDIRVYFDGEYEYTTTTDDYYAMTVDAMATTNTVAMDFDSPIWLSTNEFFVTGRHVFYDPNEERQTVYVSHRFRRLGGEWFLVAVGSSLEPIQHQYHDFRA